MRIPALFAAMTAIFLSSTTATLAQSGQIEFNAPSGNIGCTYTPRGGTGVYVPADGGPEISCDRVEPSYMRVVLGPRGPAQIIRDVGDPSCCNDARVLQYGQQWRGGPFTCESRQTGLSCWRADGPGFTVSRRGIERN